MAVALAGVCHEEPPRDVLVLLDVDLNNGSLSKQVRRSIKHHARQHHGRYVNQLQFRRNGESYLRLRMAFTNEKSADAFRRAVRNGVEVAAGTLMLARTVTPANDADPSLQLPYNTQHNLLIES